MNSAQLDTEGIDMTSPHSPLRVRTRRRLAALLLCAPAPAAYTIVNGRVVVREGQLTTLELGPLVERHNQLARQLVGA